MTGQRLFFAITPDSQQRQQLAHWHRQALPAIKPVPMANYHLTLAFVGDHVDAKALIRLAQRISFTPFSVTVEHLGQWRNSGILYLGCRQPPSALMTLAQALQQVSEQLGGQPQQHPYQPHLTLARHCHQPVTPQQPAPAITLAARHFGLYVSAAGRYHCCWQSD
ncbi:RNA 2',3'-cyclic phosphodiesterase [Gallaecimonas sp. GXIMD1310]|uniref:RNA 2',3'-cyclic phosphodiesterase n=1 Tax=Gallaecimonas sp. GXIMD1310 TaxID=3131926 RepID=UPI0032535523